MTRFARAKGSKASNERLPEPPTSWSEMKETLLSKNKELEEQKNRDKVLQRRDASYQAFLKEKEEENDKKISWAEFPEAQGAVKKQKNGPNKRKFDLEHDIRKGTKKTKGFTSLEAKRDESDDSDGEFSALKSQVDKVLVNQKFKGSSDSDSDAPPEEASINEKPQDIVVKKVKKPKQKLQIIINQENKSNWLNPQSVPSKKSKDNEIPSKKVKNANISDKEKKLIEKKQERYIKQLEKKQIKRNETKLKKKEENHNKPDSPTTENKSSPENLSEIDKRRQEKKLERRKKQKEKKLQKKQELGTVDNKVQKEEENLTEKDLEKIKKKKERRARQAEKRKKIREAKEASNEHLVNGDGNNTGNIDKASSKVQNRIKENGIHTEQQQERKPIQKPPNNPKPKKAKLKDNKDFQRNKSRAEVMFINGKNVEIDYIEGFPVKKEDADRIRKLRKEMISKGLPRSEINIALKLERRRAEKALAREKKNVCFNCRKSGHNLSECPALETDQVAQTSGTGICFKCGSTEHTHFECKVVKGLDYKFATCFICKEQGHISRQCPDNQRGLYPKGGSCKVCGDVTHLKKDCPKYQMQQSQLQGSLDIETLDNTNPDDLGSKWKSNNNNGPVKRFNKKIKF